MKKFIKEAIPYVVALILVLLTRAYIVTPITVSGDSMEPTLHGNELMMLVKVGKIDRYDIIVANYEKEHLIKRVYAFPGETIECIDGKILVNNKVIKDPYGSGKTSDFEKITLKEDEYFVLGDNREVSLDSRSIGPIKNKDILGETSFIVYPFNRFGNVKKK